MSRKTGPTGVLCAFLIYASDPKNKAKFNVTNVSINEFKNISKNFYFYILNFLHDFEH